MIEIKSKEEIKIMREGGKIASRVLKEIADAAKPGVSTAELDKLAYDRITGENAKPSFLGHFGYPASICTSINNEVVHGIPSKKRILKEGDILGIDIGVLYKDFHTDTAITVAIGRISYDDKRLIEITANSLEEALKIVKPGIYLGDIQNKIQNIIESAKFGVIRDLAGHGIGRKLQEMPSIPNYGRKKSGLVLKEGMTIAIEPMVSFGDWHVKILEDGWTVITADGSKAAHFEHTIAVTENGLEILTL